MTENEISEIAAGANGLADALRKQGFSWDEAMELTRAAMPVIVSTVLGVVTLADA
jgi:hypothetical protein